MLPGGNSWEGGDNFGQGVISADCHVQGHRRSHSAGNEATQTLELAKGVGQPADGGRDSGNGAVPGVPGAGVDAGRAMVGREGKTLKKSAGRKYRRNLSRSNRLVASRKRVKIEMWEQKRERQKAGKKEKAAS